MEQILHSENIVNISKKLLELQKLGTDVTKDSKNPFLKNLYASLNSHLDVIIPSCIKLGVTLTQIVSSNHLVTMVVDVDSGEWIKSFYPLNLKDKNSQEIGSQITYARRYMLSSLFNMRAIDDDGNESSGRVQGFKKEVIDSNHKLYASVMKKKQELGEDKFKEWTKTQTNYEFKI